MAAPAATRARAGLAVCGTLLLLALATAPWAQASTIYACVKKKGGSVHLVSKAARCSKREAKESWNAKQPAGARGAAGVRGAAGLNGANGVSGATGPAGPTVETGTTGPRGSNGLAGPEGTTGEAGASGVTGAKGTNGDTGTAGTSGATGEPGATGPTGSGGAVGGYSASKAGSVNFTLGKPGAPTPILTKEGVPAGSFIVYAKLVVAAADTEPGATWLAECTLVDKPASGATTEDTAGASGNVVADRVLDDAQATLSFGMAVTTTSASTLTLACINVSNSSKTGNFALRATFSLITAVQTTLNS